MKFINGLMIAGMVGMLLSCNDNDTTAPEPEENPNEEPAQEQAVNLSETEMANCYIVEAAGKYVFKADNQFNLGEGLPVPPELHPASAGLIWQTEKGLIKNVELSYDEDTPYISFDVEKAEGNALIALYNAEGEIEWSWHIWMPKEAISSTTTFLGYEVMNMNLGALSNSPGEAESYGMLYQWGRKDPFPAAATLTGNTSTVSAPMYDINGREVKIQNSAWTDLSVNTLEYAISHPTVCLSNYAQFSSCRDWLKEGLSDDALWGNPDGNVKDETGNVYNNRGRKTCYDPSPAGWRVPPVDVFHHFTTTGGYAWDFDDFNLHDLNQDGVVTIDDYTYGWHFMINDDTPLYFPAAARFDGSYAMLMGSMSGLWGNYWSNAPYADMNGGAVCALAFQVKDMNGNEMVTVSPSAASSRADAFSVRCIRD